MIETIIYNFSPNDNRPFASINVFENEIVGLLDSGANRSAIGNKPRELLRRLGLHEYPSNKNVKVANGQSCKVDSYINVPVTYKNRTIVIPMLVVPSLCRDLILGMDFWKGFEIEPVCNISIIEDEDHSIKLSTSERGQLNDLVKNMLSSAPGYIGTTSVLSHSIDTGNSPPIVQRPYYVSPYVQKEINGEIDRMISLGVIEPSSSPWCNPVVAVKKKNKKVRLCLDSRKLNAVTKKESSALPFITRILGRLKSTKYLTSLDLSDAFWQVPLEEGSKEKTAFVVPGKGFFQFKGMPFGLVNAAQTLSKLMERVLGYDLEPCVFTYLDDILICTETFEEHLDMLAKVSERLKKANLTINLEKSKFCVKQLKYLGYLIEPDGLKTDPQKVEPIINYPIPTSAKQVRRFVGMTSWYRRFIVNFSDLSAPITELTKHKKFVWTEEANLAFLKLKSALVSAPVLSNPNYELPFIITCDASDSAIGGTLTQIFEDGEHVIAYASQKLTTAQRKYFTCEKELLAVLVCIEKFRGYVEGVHFDVITDNSAVVWLNNFKDPSGRLARWALKLQRYNFTVSHRKGKLNVVADALSRSLDVLEVFSMDNTLAIDSWYDSLFTKVKTDPFKNPLYQIEKDRLYRNCKSKNLLGIYENQWKMVVPNYAREAILRKLHDVPTAGHLGFFKTLHRVREKYFWPKMSNEVLVYVNNCDRCKAIKYPTKTNLSPMGKSKSSDEPWQLISVDYIGPFLRSKRGYSYILIITDWLTKFTILKPLRKAETGVTIKCLEEDVFLTFGVPQVLISDNGVQFKSKQFVKFLDSYSVRHMKNANYFAQHNPSERVNRVINACIRAYIGKNHRDWDLHISEIACAMRTSKHESTGSTPYFLNFGREMVISGGEYDDLNRKNYDIDGVNERSANLKQIRKIVKEKLIKAHDKSAIRYNLRTRSISYNVGDIVWKKEYALSDTANNIIGKYKDRYVKCKIVKKVGSNTYEIENLDGKNLGVWNTKDLKSN